MSFLKIVCAPHFHFPISLSLSFELFCQFYPSYISVYLKPCDVLLEEIVSHAAEVLADRLLRPHREPHLQGLCSWPLHNFLTHFIFILTQREFLCWIWFALFFPSRSANTLCIMHICIAGPWFLVIAFLPAFCMFAFAFECLRLVFSLAYFYFCPGHCLLGPAMPIHPNAHALCIAPMSPAPP